MGIHFHSHHDHDDHDHDHDHHHSHGHAHSHGGAPKALFRALIVTVIFMLIEVIGGFWANSLALLSDAAHMLTDVGAILLSLFVIWMAKRPSTPTMSFGYHRAEILGALASGLTIWLLSGLLVYEAVVRMSNPPEVNGPVVLAVAAFGLGANLLSMWMLRSSKEGSINVRAAYLHMISDALGSVAAVVAGATLWLTGWRPIDPIITVIFAALMLVNSWSLVKESIGVLMESTPGHVDPAAIQKDLQDLPGVKEAHDLHVWSVSTGRLALSVHLISEDAGDRVLALAHGVLKERYGIVHTTIQVEHPDKFQSERCYDCRPG